MDKHHWRQKHRDWVKKKKTIPEVLLMFVDKAMVSFLSKVVKRVNAVDQPPWWRSGKCFGMQVKRLWVQIPSESYGIFSGLGFLLPRVCSSTGPVARLKSHSCPVVVVTSVSVFLANPLPWTWESPYGGLIVGCTSDLLFGGNAHSVWLHGLDKIVVRRGQSRCFSTSVVSK